MITLDQLTKKQRQVVRAAKSLKKSTGRVPLITHIAKKIDMNTGQVYNIVRAVSRKGVRVPVAMTSKMRNNVIPVTRRRKVSRLSKNLTQLQMDTFEAIKLWFESNTQNPLVKDIAHILNHGGPEVASRIRALARKGYISYNKHRRRSIQLIKAQAPAVHATRVISSSMDNTSGSAAEGVRKLVLENEALKKELAEVNRVLNELDLI